MVKRADIVQAAGHFGIHARLWASRIAAEKKTGPRRHRSDTLGAEAEMYRTSTILIVAVAVWIGGCGGQVDSLIDSVALGGPDGGGLGGDASVGGAGGRAGHDGSVGAGGQGGSGAVAGAASSGGAGGTCGNTSSDPHNCGFCGHDCLGGACSAGTCMPVTLASNPFGSWGIAVDATAVYWTNVSTGGSVMKVGLSGGTPVTLANQDSPNAIAVDANAVYWANNGGTVMKVAK